MKTMILFLVMITTSVFANSHKKEKHEHREHGAHVHGSANLAIAFDDAKGKVEFKGAAEAILGFEHQARSEKDKKTLADATSYFEKEMSRMVKMDPALNCQFAKETVGQVPEEGEKNQAEHSDWSAVFTVTCAKAPVGSKITVDFTHFPHLNDLDITVLAGSIQKSAEYKKKPVTIDLN